jgi:predicted transcriptional regulator
MSSSELVADSNENPHAVLDAAVEAADIRNEGLDHVRSITPLFSPALYDIFRQFIDRDTTFKIIYDQPTYRRLTQPNRIHYLATAIAAPTIEVRIHPDPLYTGVGIYNHDTVMVCGSTRFEKQYGIVSDRGELLTWSNEIFDQLWAESESLSSRLAGWVKQTVATRS